MRFSAEPVSLDFFRKCFFEQIWASPHFYAEFSAISSAIIAKLTIPLSKEILSLLLSSIKLLSTICTGESKYQGLSSKSEKLLNRQTLPVEAYHILFVVL